MAVVVSSSRQPVALFQAHAITFVFFKDANRNHSPNSACTEWVLTYLL